MQELDAEPCEKDSLSWESLRLPSNSCQRDLRAGLQPSLRLFISHCRRAFYIRHDGLVERASLASHLELCREVIQLYRIMARQWLLSEDSWLHLLQTLLEVTGDLLQGEPPTDGISTLASELAQPLLKVRISAATHCPAPTTLTNPNPFHHYHRPYLCVLCERQ